MQILFVFMCKYVCIFYVHKWVRLLQYFLIYKHKYVFFDAVVQNHLDHLTLCKRCLNGPNAKWKTTDCLSFSI